MKPSTHLRPGLAALGLLMPVLCATASAQTVVDNKTVTSGEKYQVQDPALVTTANTVLVQSGGIATFRSSGSVSLRPGFTASSGGFFQASIVNGTTVPLAWTIVGGATGYNVYRGATLLNSSPLTVTSYADATAAPGSTYTYTIKSITGGSETTLVTYTLSTAGPLEVFTPLP